MDYDESLLEWLRLVNTKSGETMDTLESIIRLCEDEEAKRKNIEKYRKRAAKRLPLFEECKNSIMERRKRWGYGNPKGYCWIERIKKYRAQICVNGKTIRLGYFITAKEAHNAYLKARKKYHK